MDTLFFDDHNILLNGQPYPFNSIRPRYPAVAGDNTGILWFPWWTTNALWSGDVTRLVNGLTGVPFTGISDFKAFVDAHFYTSDFSGGLDFVGLWNASTNTPFLTNGVGTSGQFYVTTVGGTVDFGAGSITFTLGDWVIYDGVYWDKIPFASIHTLQQVTDAGSTSTHNLQIAGLLDQSTAAAIVFNTNGFTAMKAGTAIFDSNLNQSSDNSGNKSISPNSRALYDSSGAAKYAWDTNQAKDSSGTISADLDNRQLYSSDGSLRADYSTPGLLMGYTKMMVMNAAGRGNVELNTEDSTYPNMNVYNYTTNVGVALQCSSVPTIVIYDNSGTDYILLECTGLPGSGTNNIDFQAASGTVAFLSDIPAVGGGSYSATGTAGQTVYNIPHGLAFTPAFAAITPRNAAAATLIVGSYYLSYDATNIVLTLLVATAGTPSIHFDWVALP